MTVEFLSTITGIALSLVFGYFPKVKEWFNKFESGTKQLITLGVAAVLGLIIFGLGCIGWAERWGLPVLSCDINGLQDLLEILFRVMSSAIITYGGTKYIHKS